MCSNVQMCTLYRMGNVTHLYIWIDAIEEVDIYQMSVGLHCSIIVNANCNCLSLLYFLAEDFEMCRVTCFGWGKSGTDKKDTGTIPKESWRDQCHDGRETQEWGTFQTNENENLNWNIIILMPNHNTCTIIPATTLGEIFIRVKII